MLEQGHVIVYGLIALLAILTVGVAGGWLRARAESERLRRRLIHLLDSAPVGIITTDRSKRCTVVNRAAAEILGRRAEDLIGVPIDIVLDKLPTTVEHSTAPIVEGGVEIGLFLTFTDTTTRRRLEAQLDQARRVDSLGRLAASVAHEFNNILMGIQPLVDILSRDVPAEKRQKAGKSLQDAIQRGKRVTGEILSFTRPADPVRSAVEVWPLFESFAAEARGLVGRDCDLRVEVDGPLFIHVDRNQFIQTLSNLVLNARDAMGGKGQIVLSAKRETSEATFAFGVIEHPERYIHISVTDEGAGIKPEIMNHIFEPLFTTKHTGTGLGLAVVGSIVKRNNGEIFVESVVGRGTTFHLFMPAAADIGDAQPLPERRPERPPSSDVLIVEDDPDVAEGISGLLTEADMSVDLAPTGTEALELLRRKHFDVVVLDINLPDMSGLEVYDQLLTLHPSMPVVFSTGHADVLDQQPNRPSTRLLRKPYEADDLLNTIDELRRAAVEIRENRT